MAKKSKKSTASLDVRSPKDIPMFESLLKKGPMAVVLVYADWCGHCQTFKNKVWNESTLNQTKNLNTAAVHYDMVDQTSLKNTPIQGYPSMFLVGKDEKPKEIPTPQTPEELMSLDAKSENVLNSGNRNSGNMNNGNMNSGNRNSGNMNNGNMNSGNRNSGNMNSGNMNSGNRNSGNRNNSNSYTPSPPDALEDMMNTSETVESKQSGGSLFDMLSSFSQGNVNLTQQNGGRRKTRRRRNRRAQTRRR